VLKCYAEPQTCTGLQHHCTAHRSRVHTTQKLHCLAAAISWVLGQRCAVCNLITLDATILVIRPYMRLLVCFPHSALQNNQRAVSATGPAGQVGATQLTALQLDAILMLKCGGGEILNLLHSWPLPFHHQSTILGADATQSR
jgi:hypothetical protein